MKSTIEPTESSRCLKPNESSMIFYGPVFANETGVSLSILAVILYLKWPSVNILYDKNTESEAAQLHNRLSRLGTFAVLYDLEEMSSERIDSLMSFLSQSHDESILNVTILCRLEFCLEYIGKPFEYTRKHTVRSSLVHNSKWLLGIFHDGDLSSLESNSTELDNVAVIQYPTSFLNGKFLNFDSSDESTWLQVKTLMWVNEQKRGLSTVGYTQIKGSLYTEKDIFPNANMGFNQRRLKVSTLPWPPFVSYDNTSGKYSGFVIDVLQFLAHRLNFTYDITRPKDNQWGVDRNGSWTGLIGQLQRFEVDMVAAAIAIQSERERVMDFAHPYFYETSAILLKKPDPAATKWRTLIDPFSTTVIVCMVIVLPVSSFFLFFFEKNNPYYRQVEDRYKVRGLHNFSGSFWYMYGALLTQGGEHMADSWAGRTFLSFWWMFCIIMMATYSGNLIAFLTVTKDKLPFNNLAELVNQDDYKWGILGGTSFESVFKASELPDQQKFWSKLVEFNRTDPTVISIDSSIHMDKVKDGKYAFMADKTFMEFNSLDNCDLAISPTDIFPLKYTIGLPNNSPNTKIIAHEIMTMHERGLLKFWKTNHWPRPRICQESLIKNAKPITLIDIHSAFYLIAIGIFLGTVPLCFEIFKHKCRNFEEESRKAEPESRHNGES